MKWFNGVADIALTLVLLCPTSVMADEPADRSLWQVGFGKADITPEWPVQMSGYSGRVEPSKGVEARLYAKAMAIEDAGGQKAVLITMDLSSVGDVFAEPVYEQVADPEGLARDCFLLTCSHTHSGPSTSIDEDRPEATVRYTCQVQKKLIQAARDALSDMRPARLSWGWGVAPFVMNRREFTPRGIILGTNPRGFADRSVPVLRVDDAEGKLRGVVFGCACHATTLGSKNYKISGDYPGFAQEHIEAEHPGVQAMFVAGCAGDANPYPRGGNDEWIYARQHGQTLGTEVCRVLAAEMQPVAGPLRVARGVAEIPFQPQLSRNELEAVAAGRQKSPAANARALLAKLDAGETLPTYQKAPVSVWQFGQDLTLVALSGEVVSGYVPLIEKAIGPLGLWVAAYAHDSIGYVTTARVQSEGGYEAKGMHGRGLLALDAQEAYVGKVRELAERAGREMP